MKLFYKNKYLQGINWSLGVLFGILIITTFVFAYEYISPGTINMPDFSPEERNVQVSFVPGDQGSQGDIGPKGGTGSILRKTLVVLQKFACSGILT